MGRFSSQDLERVIVEKACIRSIIIPLFSMVLSASLAAAEPDDCFRAVPHLRTTDPDMRALVATAFEQSPSFRKLVQRLEGSDVVVYLEFAPLNRQLRGRLTWMVAAARLRYVRVQLEFRQMKAVRLEMLGHELQHAVEIADAESVVDLRSLERLYKHIGYVTEGDGQFESSAAAEMGRLVAREARGRRGRRITAETETGTEDAPIVTLPLHARASRAPKGPTP
jgi:hypothetical protein